eukprot:1177861-Prymnesium_polylepis.1
MGIICGAQHSSHPVEGKGKGGALLQFGEQPKGLQARVYPQAPVAHTPCEHRLCVVGTEKNECNGRDDGDDCCRQAQHHRKTFSDGWTLDANPVLLVEALAAAERAFRTLVVWPAVRRPVVKVYPSDATFAGDRSGAGKELSRLRRQAPEPGGHGKRLDRGVPAAPGASRWAWDAELTEQVAAPEGLLRRYGHGMHCPCPRLDAYDPRRHGVHATCPGDEKKPGGQRWHSCCPGLFVNVPDAHAFCSTLPVMLKKPGSVGVIGVAAAVARKGHGRAPRTEISRLARLARFRAIIALHGSGRTGRAVRASLARRVAARAALGRGGGAGGALVSDGRRKASGLVL